MNMEEELFELITKTCCLSANVVKKLKLCGINVRMLKNMNIEDYADFELGLGKETIKRIHECIKSKSSTSSDEFLSDVNNSESGSTNEVNSHDITESESEVVIPIKRKINIRNFSDKAKQKKIKLDENVDFIKGANKTRDDTDKNSESNNIRKLDDVSASVNTSRSFSDASTIAQISPIPQCTRLSYEIISSKTIQTILEDSLEGLSILAEYNKEKILESASRKLLVSLIINRCVLPLECSSVKFFEKVANSIIDLLPEENIDLYFIAPLSQGNVRKNPKGLLCDKWRNVLHRINKAGLKTKPAKNTLETKSRIEATTLNFDETLKSHMKWLKKNRDPWDTVKEHWQLTYEYRCKSNKLQCDTFDHIFEEQWPILTSTLGPRLFELDFNYSYPNSYMSMEKNWDTFFSDLYSIRKTHIKSELGCQLCKIYEECLKSENEIICDNVRILLLPYLLPATGKIASKSKSRKPSIAECAEAFYVSCNTLADLEKALNDRSSRYTALKEQVQPCLALVGKNATCIESCYIRWGKYSWKFNSAVRACDILFQIYMLFNLEYPKDCVHVWLLIQHKVFNIHTEWDPKIPSTLNIETSLQHLLKKRQVQN